MGESGQEMYRKLGRPLSFIGEERSDYAYIEDSWVDLNDLLNDPDREMPVEKLKERLEWIKKTLLHGKGTYEDSRDLYLEGMGIKRALHLAGSKDRVSSSKTQDTKRWLDYGKRIR